MKIRQIHTKDHEQPPDQLEVRNGKLVASDGTRPDFSNLPDGKYNLLTRRDHIQLRDDAFLGRHWAC